MKWVDMGGCSNAEMSWISAYSISYTLWGTKCQQELFCLPTRETEAADGYWEDFPGGGPPTIAGKWIILEQCRELWAPNRNRHLTPDLALNTLWSVQELKILWEDWNRTYPDQSEPPSYISSDQGTCFTECSIQQWAKRYLTSNGHGHVAHHPQNNGLIENRNGQLKHLLSNMDREKGMKGRPAQLRVCVYPWSAWGGLREGLN